MSGYMIASILGMEDEVRELLGRRAAGSSITANSDFINDDGARSPSILAGCGARLAARHAATAASNRATSFRKHANLRQRARAAIKAALDAWSWGPR